MPYARSLDDMVRSLASDLEPVRRLPRPAVRAASWVALACAMAACLALGCDLRAVGHRLSGAPDMWLSALGSALTAGLAAVAAFELSVPGRRALWAALPVPALALWLSASGMGCLRGWTIPGLRPPPLSEAHHCIAYLLMLSIPLMAAMIAMLRSAFPLRPNLTALVAGLAVAAASASLLNLIHPYDASALSAAVHLAALLVVMGLNFAVSRRASA